MFVYEVLYCVRNMCMGYNAVRLVMVLHKEKKHFVDNYPSTVTVITLCVGKHGRQIAMLFDVVRVNKSAHRYFASRYM